MGGLLCITYSPSTLQWKLRPGGVFRGKNLARDCLHHDCHKNTWTKENYFPACTSLLFSHCLFLPSLLSVSSFSLSVTFSLLCLVVDTQLCKSISLSILEDVLKVKSISMKICVYYRLSEHRVSEGMDADGGCISSLSSSLFSFPYLPSLSLSSTYARTHRH